MKQGLIMLLAACLFGLAMGVQADNRHKNNKEKHKLAVEKVKGPLSVMVLGSGGPIATAAGRASAGYLIFTDGKPRILMDIGGGTFARIAESGVILNKLDTVLLSHLHQDHTGDMSAVTKTVYFHNRLTQTTRSTETPVNFFGPGKNNIPQGAVYDSSSTYVDGHYHEAEGLERYLHAFAPAIGAGQFAYSATDVPSNFFKMVDGVRMPADIRTIIDTDDGLVVKAVGVNHGPVPALAFRIEYKGHSVVYSGDTSSMTPNMARISAGADMLIYDTAIMDDAPLNPDGTRVPVFFALHTTPSRLGDIAAMAQPKTLVLSHITPVTENRLDEVKTIIESKGFAGKIKKAKDLKVYNLGDDD